MATHSNSGAFSGRKFAISRENGQSDKEGRPYFFEYLEALPSEDARRGRKFETRNGKDSAQNHYELFAAIDGHLVDISQEVKTFNGTKEVEQWLVLTLVDGGETYRIEVGRMDGRYALDIMKRLLDPAFDPKQKTRLSPFSIKDDQSGKWNIGLSAMCGTDTKLSASMKDSHLANMPQAKSMEFGGKLQWDFTPVSNWLYEQLHAMVVPALKSVAHEPAPARVPLPPPTASAPRREPEDDRFPQHAPPAEAGADDLPF